MSGAATITPAPVRQSIVVEAPINKAFETFTKGIGTWWPATHSIGESALKTAIIEPRNGGRWYEISEDGSECDWGEVLIWNEPSKLVLAWRIGVDWRYDPSLLTEVEVTFTAVDGSTTRVDLEHRLLENLGNKAAAARETLDSPGGWPGLLAAYSHRTMLG